MVWVVPSKFSMGVSPAIPVSTPSFTDGKKPMDSATVIRRKIMSSPTLLLDFIAIHDPLLCSLNEKGTGAIRSLLQYRD